MHWSGVAALRVSHLLCRMAIRGGLWRLSAVRLHHLHLDAHAMLHTLSPVVASASPCACGGQHSFCWLRVGALPHRKACVAWPEDADVARRPWPHPSRLRFAAANRTIRFSDGRPSRFWEAWGCRAPLCALAPPRVKYSTSTITMHGVACILGEFH